MNAPPPSIESIFIAAIEQASEDDMLAVAAKACGQDLELFKSVERLIKAHCKSGSRFLEAPATGMREALEGKADTVALSGSMSVLRSISDKFGPMPTVSLRDDSADTESPHTTDSCEIPHSEGENRYQIHGEIAKGGMGAVLKARDVDLGRELAIKVLLEAHQGKTAHVERFVEEAQIGGQLQHPGIVPVYEIGQFKDARPFFTMKLVKGETLAAILAKRASPLKELPRLLGIFEQICQTMAFAHTKGVIHRDLKPANIMVGAFGEVQVMDWGLSKVLSSGCEDIQQSTRDQHHDVDFVETSRSAGNDTPGNLGSETAMGDVMGTLAYMPPEQALGDIDRIDQRADVFGLGAILAEILTGRPAYVAANTTELFRMAREGRVEACVERVNASGAEPELLAICKKSLAADPAVRFNDAEQLAAEVTGFLEGVQERLKQTELARVQAQARSVEEGRRKKLYLAIASLMCILAVGTAFGAYSYKKQNDALATEKRNVEIEKEKVDDKNREIADQLIVIGREKDKAIASRIIAVAEDFEPVSKLLAHIEVAEISKRVGIEFQRLAHAKLLEAAAAVGGIPFGYAVQAGDWGWMRGGVQFSQDNRWLIMGNRLFDLEGENPWSSPLRLHEDYVLSKVAFSPDSRWVATVGTKQDEDQQSQSVTHLVDLENLGSPAAHRTLLLTSDVAFDSDSRWLACREGMFVRFWDLSDAGATAPSHTIEFSQAVSRLLFSPTVAGSLAVGSTIRSTEATTTSLWNWDGTQFVQGADLPGSRPAFSPNGVWLATATVNEVNVWTIRNGEVATGQEPLVIAAKLDVYDQAPLFTADSRRLITSVNGADGKIWDLSEPASPSVSLEGACRGLVVGPNNRWLAGSSNAWDLTSNDSTITPIEIEAAGGDMAFSHDGQWLVAGSRRWNVDTLDSVRSRTFIRSPGDSFLTRLSPGEGYLTSLQPSTKATPFFQRFELLPNRIELNLGFELGAEISCAGLSDNQHWLVVGKEDGSVDVYDLRQASMSQPVSVQPPHKGAIHQAAISDDGQLLLTAAADQTVYTTRMALSTDSPVKSQVIASGIESFRSPNGKIVASISKNKQWAYVKHPMRATVGATVWRLDEQFNRVGQFEISGDQIYWDLMFSPDGRYALSRSDVECLWDLSAAEPFTEPIQLKGRVSVSPWTAAAFSRDGSMLVVGENEGTGGASVWDLRADDPSASRMQLVPGRSVTKVAISPDNKLIATGNRGGKVHIWFMDGEDPSANPLVLDGNSGPFYSLDFHPTLSMLVSHSQGGDIRLWNYDLDSAIRDAHQLAGRTLSLSERETLELLDE